MKKYTFKFDIEIPTTAMEETQSKSSIKNSIRKKYFCINCQAQLEKVGLRNYIICPKCNTKNPVK